MAAAYASYRLSLVEGPYNVSHRHDEDSQEFELTNGLYGVKTVRWYCLWLDNYVYSDGNRPDVYLDIYARRHVKDEHCLLYTSSP